MLQLAQRNLENRTGVINCPAAPVRPRPGHATVHHHWGIRPLRLEIAPRKTLYEEFHPYGTSAYRAFQSSEVSAKRYRYTGKERDEETKLYYYGARYLAPWLGRWMSPDPKGLVDGPGLYNYVRGSPINLRDPSGTQGETGQPINLETQKQLVLRFDVAKEIARHEPPPAPEPDPTQRYGELEKVVGPQGVQEFRTGGAGRSLEKAQEKIFGKPLTEADIAQAEAELPAAMAEMERQKATPGAYGPSRLQQAQRNVQTYLEAPISGDPAVGMAIGLVASKGYSSPEALRWAATEGSESLQGVYGAAAAAGVVKAGRRSMAKDPPVQAGEAGQFSALEARGRRGDELTPHHMPQVAAGFTTAPKGGALVLPHTEHVRTRTYGGRGRAVARAERGLPFRRVLARDIRDVRRQFGTKYDPGLRNLIRYYRQEHPELMRKQ